MVELAGGAVVPGVQLAAEHEPHPQAGTDREERKVVDAARHALPFLAERGEVDVVHERHVEAEAPRELVAECDALELEEMRQVEPSFGIDDTGHADDDATDPLAAGIGGLDQRRGDRLDRGDRGLGARAGELDVLAHADRAGEVADRAAGKARAQVEAEHEGGVGNGLEEHGAEARAVGAMLGFAHEARFEQRLQRERDRRFRDPGAARDLGPRDRRVRSHGLEHGAQVEPLEQRRSCTSSRIARHLVANPNGKCRLHAGLDAVTGIWFTSYS